MIVLCLFSWLVWCCLDWIWLLFVRMVDFWWFYVMFGFTVLLFICLFVWILCCLRGWFGCVWLVVFDLCFGLFEIVVVIYLRLVFVSCLQDSLFSPWDCFPVYLFYCYVRWVLCNLLMVSLLYCALLCWLLLYGWLIVLVFSYWYCLAFEIAICLMLFSVVGCCLLRGCCLL